MVVVDIHDYACVSFVPWGNLDGVVLFQDFECISQFFLEVRLWQLSLLKDIVNNSSYSVCLFDVELSDS